MEDPSQIGVKETSEAAAFVGEIITALVDAAADGKFDWFEALKFRGAAAALPSAVNGYEKIPAEIADLTPEEAEEVRTAFAFALTLPKTPGAEGVIEEGLGLALLFIGYIQKIRQLRANPAA